MRELLFKAKRVDNQEWVEGYYYYDNCEGSHIITQPISKPPCWSEPGGENYNKSDKVDPETVCFASSRVDENKVKIFGDDIIEFTVFDHNDNDTQYTGIVKWTGDRFIVVKSELDPFFGSDGPFDLDWICDQDDTIKVTSNIHDKKEGV